MNIKELTSNYIVPISITIGIISLGIFDEIKNQEDKNNNDYIIRIGKTTIYAKKENLKIINGELYLKENNRTIKYSSNYSVRKIR